MSPCKQGKLFDIFDEIEDPRRNSGHFLYPIPDLILLSITAVVCGADEWTKAKEFGHSQRSWLRQYRPFRHGIPSHDTLGRIFGRLPAE